MGVMAEQGTGWSDLCRALAESWAPKHNWRWMLPSLGIGAGYGVIGGLYRLGNRPATISPEVALTSARVALVFFIMVWLVAAAVRFGRLRRARSE